MKLVKVVVLLVVMVLVIAFLFQNYTAFLAATTLKFKLPGLKAYSLVPIPLYALLLGAFLLAGLFTVLYCGLGNFRLRRSIRRLQKEKWSLQEELNSLRQLPVTEGGAPSNQSAGTLAEESAEESGRVNSGKTT